MGVKSEKQRKAALVSVCVCTYKRPQLKACLHSIAAQQLPNYVTLRIVVVDNCPELSAKIVVDNFIEAQGLDVQYCALSDKNLSRVRNRSLAEATGDYIALIDDDELASETWLNNLIECSNKYNADVVVGPVFNNYSKACPAWLAEADLMARLTPSTGELLKTGHAGNALIRRSSLESSAVLFDERLGCSGGEDTDFFYRMHLSGKKIVGCYEAQAFEAIDPSRENMAYLVMENKRIGQVFCRVIWPLLSVSERLFALLFIFAKVCFFGAAYLLTLPVGKRYSTYWQLRCICNLEKIRYLFRKNDTIVPYCS